MEEGRFRDPTVASLAGIRDFFAKQQPSGNPCHHGLPQPDAVGGEKAMGRVTCVLIN